MKKLPDYVTPSIEVLFVGINPGLRSAVVGHHYAGYSNRFWKLLNEAKIVPVPLTYHDDARLPEWGVGLTNLVSRPTSGSGSLTSQDFQIGRARLAGKIRRYRIPIVALLGITLYPILLPRTTSQRAQPKGHPLKPKLGLQPETFAGARVFLLPNPSGRNAHYSYNDMLVYYRKLQKLVRSSKLETSESKKSK